jgi:gelsolin
MSGENKEDEEKLADTNMENYGSKEHRDLRQNAAEKEKAWKGAGAEAGLQIWRIEKFEVKKWPKKRYGQFHTGDSYIILHTIKEDAGLAYDAYFWLGAQTSQDEAGTAAYKTVELDDLLGDAPVQYREVQGNESSGFLELFKCLEVLPGGVASGFNKVEEEDFKPYLLKCTGHKKNVQIYDVTHKSKEAVLNDTDTFILDMGLKVFCYHGAHCTAWERRAANAKIQRIKGSPGRGKAKDVHIDGFEDESKEYDPFWEYFGGKPKELKAMEEQVVADIPMKMIKVSDDDGSLKCTEILNGSLDRSKLESDDAFILDTGISIYLWIGKTCKPSEKREAMAHVHQYMSEHKRPKNIPVCRVIEGKEPKHFISMMDKCGDGKWDAKMMQGGYCGRKSSKMVMRDS